MIRNSPPPDQPNKINKKERKEKEWTKTDDIGKKNRKKQQIINRRVNGNAKKKAKKEIQS